MDFASAVQLAGCLLVIVTFAAAVYAASCWLHPLRLCRVCHGTGRQRAAIFRAYRLCNHCAGAGTRPRAGRRIYERMSNRR